ncbi:MAG: hypothetical protein CSA62_07890 [Planctomycetota bacterium]|nr:MAG: hypothetical protein CSA62_07890 [Planctomycetota bacterium]
MFGEFLLDWSGVRTQLNEFELAKTKLLDDIDGTLPCCGPIRITQSAARPQQRQLHLQNRRSKRRDSRQFAEILRSVDFQLGVNPLKRRADSALPCPDPARNWAGDLEQSHDRHEDHQGDHARSGTVAATRCEPFVLVDLGHGSLEGVDSRLLFVQT